jgi:hypothetical protein
LSIWLWLVGVAVVLLMVLVEVLVDSGLVLVYL